MTHACEVSFRVNCADTRMGQHVCVVGSCDALGSWKPAKGLLLHTSAAEFPTWLTADVAASVPEEGSTSKESVRLPEDEEIEYKYVICGRGGEPERWEDRPNRRVRFSSLIGRGVIQANSGRVFVTEAFNGATESDGKRFFSASSSSQRRPTPQSTTEALPMIQIAPTIRERQPSNHNLDAAVREASPPPRSASRSYSRLPEPAEEGHREATPLERSNANGVQNPAMVDQRVEENCNLLVREESCSNMFPDDFDEAEGEESTRAQQQFEHRYMLRGDGPLGEGTFGLVWRCVPKKVVSSSNGHVTDSIDDERAAKIVRKARLQPHDMRFLLGDDGEVQTHLMMKHPHVVQLFEYFDEPHTVTLVLEYCRGGDLFDAIVRHKKEHSRGLLEPAAAVVTRHILSALVYMHEQKVVHRDIKCENVLLWRAGVPAEENLFKLCDFGFAAHDRDEGLTDRLGSPDTVAPEVVCGSNYGRPVDIWSAGVLIYMMLSAMPPFYAATDREVLRKVRSGCYALNGGIWDVISQPPKDSISHMMSIEARLRPTAAEAMQAEWLVPVAARAG